MTLTYEERSWSERSTELDWPDEKAGPYLLTVGWRRMGERWECVALTVTIAKEEQLRALQTIDLRGLRLPAITARAAVKLRRELAAEVEELRAQGPPRGRTEYRQATQKLRRASEALQAAQPKRVGRPATPEAEVQRVSRIYAKAYWDHRPPTRAVAKELGLSYSAAASAWPSAAWPAFWGRPSAARPALGGCSWGTATAALRRAWSPSIRSANAAVARMAGRRGSRDVDDRANIRCRQSAAKRGQNGDSWRPKGPVYFRESGSQSGAAAEKMLLRRDFSQ